jgi:hypothetical protein
VTASDGRRYEPDGGRADDESEEESEEGRFDKYVEYALDLLSLV